jgi:putative ABC transport system permease protein
MRRSTHPALRAPLPRGDLQDKSLLRPSRRTKRKISLLEIFLMAVETLWSNKVRSGLTMLGVIIGISSVIAITSIGQGVQKDTQLKIEALGTTPVKVTKV